MRAVNLMPSGSRHEGRGAALASHGATYLVFGVLALALAFVTVYVLASNSISAKKARLTSLQTELTQLSTQSASLVTYTQFTQLVESRAVTVRGIAVARFDWHVVLDDLSKVVPANTSLQALDATVSPGTSAGGSGAGTSGSIRGAIAAPAFDLTGCTTSQDDVARLMSRLRLIDGVTRVTLGNSQKNDSAAAGAAVGATGTASSGSGTGCGANAPSFDIVVFFTPVGGSAVTTAVSSAGATAPGASTSTGATATTPGTTTTPTTSTPTATTTPTTSMPSTGPSTSTTTTPGGAR